MGHRGRKAAGTRAHLAAALAVESEAGGDVEEEEGRGDVVEGPHPGGLVVAQVLHQKVCVAEEEHHPEDGGPGAVQKVLDMRLNGVAVLPVEHVGDCFVVQALHPGWLRRREGFRVL